MNMKGLVCVFPMTWAVSVGLLLGGKVEPGKRCSDSGRDKGSSAPQLQSHGFI